VLAVNPYASTAASNESELSAQLPRIGELVRASGSNLGCVLSADGETAAFVDDQGRGLTRTQLLLALITLVSEVHDGARIALPVSTTREAERLAVAHGAEVVWAKHSDVDVMEVASDAKVAFAVTPDCGCIWPEFLPAPDGMATLAKLLELLAVTGRPLSSVVATLPAVHVAHETVPTPWERKGTVMRELVEATAGRRRVLVDGVKVVDDDGWALVLPDPEEAATHVWAEAGSDDAAAARAGEYVELIRRALEAPA